MTTSLREESRPGLLASLFGLWTAPEEAFRAIVRRRRVLAPVLGLVALQVAFTGTWLRQVNPKEFMKTQMQERGQWEKIPAESRPELLERQSSFFPVMAWSGAVLGVPVFVLIVTAVYLFILRFFYASAVTFKPALAVVAHTFLAVGLVTAPLTLLVLVLRADWNVDPQAAVQANASLLLGDREEVPKFLWSLAESLDLFSFWALWLLALGFGAASSRRWTSVLAGVLTPWVIYVLAKSTLAALF